MVNLKPETPPPQGTYPFYQSFHTPRDWSTGGHSAEFADAINSDGHLECSGRLRGEVRIGTRTYSVDALAHRDRSWGIRDYARASMHRYRMFSGTVGPELSFASFLLDLEAGPQVVAGYVARNGEEHDIRDLRVVTTIDADSFSPIGALGILTLTNGEKLRVSCTGVQGFMTRVPEAGTATSDTISTFEYNGQQGFLDLEMCINPFRGTYIPTAADVSLLQAEDGLSSSVSYDI